MVKRTEFFDLELILEGRVKKGQKHEKKAKKHELEGEKG